MAPPIAKAVTLALRASQGLLCFPGSTCPESNGCTYLGLGVLMKVDCNSEFYGGDLKSVSADNIMDCMKSCTKTSQCVGVSFVNSVCYMKKTLTKGGKSAGVIGAKVMSRLNIPKIPEDPETEPEIPKDPSPVNPNGEICPEEPTCPKNNGCRKIGLNRRSFVLGCGTDVYGNDYKAVQKNSMKDCNDECAASDKCVAASYTGGSGSGSCYLKEKNTGISKNPGVDSFYIDSPTKANSEIIAARSDAQALAPPRDQIINNPSFEAGTALRPSGWLIGGKDYDEMQTGRRWVPHMAKEGKFALWMNGWPDESYSVEISQGVMMEAGKAYKLEYWASQDLPGNCKISPQFSGEDIELFDKGELSSKLKKFEGIIPWHHSEDSQGTLTLEVECEKGGEGAAALIDLVTMRVLKGRTVSEEE